MTQTTNDKRSALVTREGILMMLSDDEVARVSTAEAAFRLAEGEEFIDLGHLDEGVKVMDGVNVPMGDVLPRKSVLERTWREILDKLAVRNRS